MAEVLQAHATTEPVMHARGDGSGVDADMGAIGEVHGGNSLMHDDTVGVVQLVTGQSAFCWVLDKAISPRNIDILQPNSARVRGPPHAVLFLKSSSLHACGGAGVEDFCLLYTSPSPRDRQKSRMPSSA